MYRKKKAIILPLLLFTILILCPEIRAQFDLRLSPLLQELELAPGSKKSFQLFLDNESKTDNVTIRAYAGDMIQEQIGAYALLEEGESEFSCADWITLSDTFFTILPESSKMITAEVKAPRDAFGGRYAAVIFEIVPEEEPAGPKLASVEYHYKMPTFVEVTIRRFGGTVKKIEVVQFKAEPITNPRLIQKVGRNAMSFTALVKNTGNMHVKAKGSLLIKTKEGKRKRQVPLGMGRDIVLPGAVLEYRSIVSKPPPGEYIAQAIIRPENQAPVAAETPFSVGTSKGSTADTFHTTSFLTLRVKPEEVIQQIPAGAFRYINLVFQSQEAESIHVDSKLMALEYDEAGNLSAVEPTETVRSCIDWLKLDPLFFDLGPGQVKNVKLIVSTPKGDSGGYYACLLFEASLKKAKQAPVVPYEIPILLNLPMGSKLNGQVTGIDVTASRDKPALIEARFQNLGNTHVKPKGKVVLKVQPKVALPAGVTYAGEERYDLFGEAFLEPVNEFVLPGGVRRLEVTFPDKLTAGKYLAEVIIDFGGKSPAKMEKEFIIK